jgi:hypothetical protein
MPTDTFFFVYTIVAGSLFAYALLWVMAMWLKAGEEEQAIRRKLHETLERPKAAGCVDPRPGCCPEYAEAMVSKS